MAESNNDIVVMKGIYKSFPGVQALENVDFTLKRGEIHALIGENGAGKSTLIKVLTGVDQPDSGTITSQSTNHLHKISSTCTNSRYQHGLPGSQSLPSINDS